MTENTETAILAGGCFWGMQDLIRKRDGVISTRVGYTGRRRAERDLRATTATTPRRSRSSSTPSRSRTATCSSSSSRSTTRRRRTARATTWAAATARRSSTRATSRSRSPRTRSPTSTPPASGRARSSPRSSRPALLGGRARAPGLPPADPERLHLPLRAAGLEAAASARPRRSQLRKHEISSASSSASSCSPSWPRPPLLALLLLALLCRLAWVGRRKRRHVGVDVEGPASGDGAAVAAD